MLHMLYCTLADPGQTKKKEGKDNEVDLEEGQQADPRRSHRTFQYEEPIRRYDHYCKWLKNVVGLLNHREFIAMLVGLSCIGVFGGCLDLYLLAFELATKGLLQSQMLVVVHLAFCIALLAIETPMLRIHIGLISRNELANEWKHHQNYIAFGTTQGHAVPVDDLEPEEYNDIFDKGNFVYDPSRNPWDFGCCTKQGREGSSEHRSMP